MGASLNKVLLMGNLTRDPQVKQLPSNSTVAEFGIACNRKFRTQNGEDREEVCFVDCAAFGKTGETIAKFFTKGKPIFVEGRLKFDQWEDKHGGKRSKLTVTVDNFQFLPDGKGGERSESSHGASSHPEREEGPFGPEKQFAAADIPF